MSNVGHGGFWANVSSGAVGFALAQLVNVGRICWAWYWRPVLVIEFTRDDMVTLEHWEMSDQGSRRELLYGFQVRNNGRSVALNSRVFLKSYQLSRDGQRFSGGHHATQLLPWSDAEPDEEYGGREVLVGALVDVRLGRWCEEDDVIYFETKTTAPYHDLSMGGVNFVRLDLVAVADGVRQAELTHTIRLRSCARPVESAAIDASQSDF